MKMILYEHQTVSVLTAAAHYPEYPQCVSATGGCRLLSPFIRLRCRQSPLGEPANPSPAHTRPTETKTRAELSIVSLRVGCWESCLYFLRVLSKDYKCPMCKSLHAQFFYLLRNIFLEVFSSQPQFANVPNIDLLNKKAAMNATQIQIFQYSFCPEKKYFTKCSQIKMITASPKPIVKTRKIPIKLYVHLQRTSVSCIQTILAKMYLLFSIHCAACR